MRYTIKNYYVEKRAKKDYYIVAEIEKRNLLGCLTDIFSEYVCTNFKTSHERRNFSSSLHTIFFFSATSKKEAEIICKVLKTINT